MAELDEDGNVIEPGAGGDDGDDQGDNGGGQDGGGDSRDWIPEDLRDEKSLDAIKDVGGLAKSYVEAQKMIGGSVRIPGEDATPEDWDAFHAKMGRPDNPEDYGLVKPDLPEGVEWDEGMVEWFGKASHKAGLSKTQAGALMESWNEIQFNKAHAGQKDMKAALDGLKESWGDKFDGRVELGLRGIERLLPAEDVTQFKGLLDSTGLGNHPLMLKFAYQVGNMLKEDGYIMGDGQGGVLGADSAKAKIAEINADKSHAHWDDTNPGHRAAVAEMAQLFKIAYPA